MKRTYKTSLSILPENKENALKELNLGYLNLKEGFFQQADLSFEMVLALDPDCADAWWGKMLAALQLSSEDTLDLEPVKYKDVLSMPECQTAIEKAEENQKKQFQQLLERMYKIQEGENY